MGTAKGTHEANATNATSAASVLWTGASGALSPGERSVSSASLKRMDAARRQIGICGRGESDRGGAQWARIVHEMRQRPALRTQCGRPL